MRTPAFPILLITLAAAMGGVALAQPAPPAPRATPSAPPAAITRAQVQARVQQRIAAVDANHDGVVTKPELDAYHTKLRADRWAGREANRSQRHEAMFATLDTNKDGQISKAEFAAAPGRSADNGRRGRDMQGSGPRFGDRRGPHGRDGMGGGLPGGFGGRGGDAMFSMLDSNKDGRITLAEASAQALARFDRIDANKDGVVTPEERRAARAGLRGPGSIMRG